LERGDRGYATKNGLVDVKIHDKEVTEPVQAPSLDTDDLSSRLGTMHLTLEGHTPSFGSRKQRRHHEELGDIEGENSDEDTDWKL